MEYGGDCKDLQVTAATKVCIIFEYYCRLIGYLHNFSISDRDDCSVTGWR